MCIWDGEDKESIRLETALETGGGKETTRQSLAVLEIWLQCHENLKEERPQNFSKCVCERYLKAQFQESITVIHLKKQSILIIDNVSIKISNILLHRHNRQ